MKFLCLLQVALLDDNHQCMKSCGAKWRPIGLANQSHNANRYITD